MYDHQEKNESESEAKQLNSKEGIQRKNKNSEFKKELQIKDAIQLKENKTGLPDTLKYGIENLSGHSMDDVKVHYNSARPAQLNAHAYAQGSQIHLGSGQEKHLPHEAWHVVQQKQGRVRPTVNVNGARVNDDVGLEKEADVMGGKALQMKPKENNMTTTNSVTQKKSRAREGSGFVGNRLSVVANQPIETGKKPSLFKTKPQSTIQRFKSYHTMRKAPVIDIDEEEANGHTIARHVCTRGQAIVRIQNEGQIPTSFWPDIATATQAIQQLLNANWGRIKVWANTPGAPQMELNGANNSGMIMYGDLVEHQSDNAKMFLRHQQNNANVETNVTIVTCYPELMQIPAIGKIKKNISSRATNWQGYEMKKKQRAHIEKTSRKKKNIYKAKPKYGRKK